MRVLLRHLLIEIELQGYLFMHFICMSVYPKNHKSDVQTELRMVPLRVKKLCPLSVCPAGQGRDRAVRTFAVLVRRRLTALKISKLQMFENYP